MTGSAVPELPLPPSEYRFLYDVSCAGSLKTNTGANATLNGASVTSWRPTTALNVSYRSIACVRAGARAPRPCAVNAS